MENSDYIFMQEKLLTSLHIKKLRTQLAAILLQREPTNLALQHQLMQLFFFKSLPYPYILSKLIFLLSVHDFLTTLHWLALWFRDLQVAGSYPVGTVMAMSSSEK